MLKSDLTPPAHGSASDPVLYGVASALAEMFPPLPVPQVAEPASPEAEESEAEG